MEKIIGIRREDKNEWERRVPLIPEHIQELNERYAIKTQLHPSSLRIFTDAEYAAVKAELKDDLSAANTIFAVKEMPVDFFEQGKNYIFFSHVIKGQVYNLPMLQRMMELKVNLIDYERIVDENNHRLIFFGRYAGLAGMIETFFAYGQKMKAAGISTPFERFKQAYAYNSLADAKTEIAQLGEYIAKNGLPAEINPVVVGFAGYGNVSMGAQEIFDLLPFREITPLELINNFNSLNSEQHLYKVVFKEEDMVKPSSGEFILQDYYRYPEKYEGVFEQYLPYLTMLVNCIYWTEQYPRLVTKKYLQSQSKTEQKLKVIGDISCDINGSIELTHKVTYPDQATFTYHPGSNRFEDGTSAPGITIMAVDNLPCEFPLESSVEFSMVLKNFVNDIVEADFMVPFEDLKLPFPIKKALILHRGKLTPEYEYIREFL